MPEVAGKKRSKIPGQCSECMPFLEWTFPKYTFHRNGRIPKDISRKSIAELTFPEYTFNVKTFLKLVSTLKSRVTYDHDTDRVTHDLDTDTTTHKIIGVVGSPFYLATPVSIAFPKSHLSL